MYLFGSLLWLLNKALPTFTLSQTAVDSIVSILEFGQKLNYIFPVNTVMTCVKVILAFEAIMLFHNYFFSWLSFP